MFGGGSNSQIPLQAYQISYCILVGRAQKSVLLKTISNGTQLGLRIPGVTDGLESEVSNTALCSSPGRKY